MKEAGELLKTHVFIFGEPNNGGDHPVITTKIFANGTPGEVYWHQEVSSEGTGKHASVFFFSEFMTPNRLRILADQLEKAEEEAIATTTANLKFVDFLNLSKPKNYKFNPEPWYNEIGDQIQCHTKDEAYFARAVDNYLDLEYSLDGKDVTGFVLHNIYCFVKAFHPDTILSMTEILQMAGRWKYRDDSKSEYIKAIAMAGEKKFAVKELVPKNK